MRYPFLFLALTILSLAQAQIIPLHLALHEGVQAIVFVEADCEDCQALENQLFLLNPVFIGAEADLPYFNYVHDVGGLAASTLRVDAFPTGIVLLNGQVASRQAGTVDHEVFEAAVRAVEEGHIKPSQQVDIPYDVPAAVELADFTGLLLIWGSDCNTCRQELEQLSELTDWTAVRIITQGEVPGSVPVLDPEIIGSWEFAGQHMRLYLQDGIPVWIDSGYRDNLPELVELIRGILAD